MTSTSNILVVTGATFEADIAAGDGVITLCSGADPARLRTLLNDIDLQNICAVVSFGLAGGLDPDLSPGDLVIADHIVAGQQTWQAHVAVTDAHHGALGGKPLRCRMAGADAAVMDPASKAKLRAATGAAAVDMETHIAAEFAERAGLPWGALRAVCDPASRALPTLATAGLKPDGGIDFATTLKSLARDPLQIPALIRTGIDTGVAVLALRRARGALGAGFGLHSLRFDSLGLGGADLG